MTKKRLFTLWLLLIAAAAPVAAQTAMTTENVTVTGTRRAFHAFAQSFVSPTAVTGKIARWEHGICPIVAGQNEKYARFISQHLQYVALAVGAPVNKDASCKPNIEIVFTTTPQDLLDAVAKDDQHYLGYFESVAQKKALATVTRPIQAWYATESTDLRGMARLDTGRSVVGGTTVGNFNALTVPLGDQVQNASANLTDMPAFFHVTGDRLNDGVHTGFRHVLIVIDSAKLAGQDIVPLADYISLLALSQLAPNACQDLPSIANRMAPDCRHEAPDSLTQYDLAYLEGLYHMASGRPMMVQLSEIGDLMTDKLEKAR